MRLFPPGCRQSAQISARVAATACWSGRNCGRRPDHSQVKTDDRIVAGSGRRGLDRLLGMWHLNQMQVLRPFFALFLVLALLPWGAFAGKAPAIKTAPQSALVQTGAGGSEAFAAAQSDTRLEAPKRCRAPVLPGSPCNPVLGLLPDTITLAQSQEANHPRASADLAAVGYNPAPPRWPPKPS